MHTGVYLVFTTRSSICEFQKISKSKPFSTWKIKEQTLKDFWLTAICSCRWWAGPSHLCRCVSFLTSDVFKKGVFTSLEVIQWKSLESSHLQPALAELKQSKFGCKPSSNQNPELTAYTVDSIKVSTVFRTTSSSDEVARESLHWEPKGGLQIAFLANRLIVFLILKINSLPVPIREHLERSNKALVACFWSSTNGRCGSLPKRILQMNSSEKQ